MTNHDEMEDYTMTILYGGAFGLTLLAGLLTWCVRSNKRSSERGRVISQPPRDAAGNPILPVIAIQHPAVIYPAGGPVFQHAAGPVLDQSGSVYQQAGGPVLPQGMSAVSPPSYEASTKQRPDSH